MNKKKIVALVTATSLVAAIGIGSTLAYFTDTDNEKNVVTFGHVDIDLEEPVFEEENEENTITNVVPGDKIMKDPTITVAEDSEDCYIRVKMDIEDLTDEQIEELLADDNIDFGDFTLDEESGYYVSDTIYTAGDVINFFAIKQGEDGKYTFEIPTSWNNSLADQTFTITFTAEAIQARNFADATEAWASVSETSPIIAYPYVESTEGI